MLQKYHIVRVTSDSAVTSVPASIMGVLLTAGTANMTIEFTNDATGAGTNALEVSALANSCSWIDLSAMGGVHFNSKIYADINGTGAVAYVFVNIGG